MVTMRKFHYPPDLVGQLRLSWKDWSPRELEAPELPDDPWLENLFEIAYHASFTADEQRRTRFSAVVCLPQDSTEPIVFAQPREFSVHELMRLAPVAVERGLSFGVGYAGPRASPEIWGLCSEAFMQLEIRVAGPGTMEIGRNGSSLVALRGGNMDRAAGGGAFSVISDYVAEANAEVWSGVSFPGATWSPEFVVYPEYFLTVAGEVARRGHGGAILVVRDADSATLPETDILRVKYACNDTSIWDAALAAIRRFDEQVISDESARFETEAAEAKITRLLSRLSSLASVDGAVLITDRLRLLGFGTEVTASVKLSTVETHDGRVIHVDSFGTRHRSAFRFCSAYPQGLAIVCSQDGGIKCINFREDKLRLSEW